MAADNPYFGGYKGSAVTPFPMEGFIAGGQAMGAGAAGLGKGIGDAIAKYQEGKERRAINTKKADAIYGAIQATPNYFHLHTEQSEKDFVSFHDKSLKDQEAILAGAIAGMSLADKKVASDLQERTMALQENKQQMEEEKAEKAAAAARVQVNRLAWGEGLVPEPTGENIIDNPETGEVLSADMRTPAVDSGKYTAEQANMLVSAETPQQYNELKEAFKKPELTGMEKEIHDAAVILGQDLSPEKMKQLVYSRLGLKTPAEKKAHDEKVQLEGEKLKLQIKELTESMERGDWIDEIRKDPTKAEIQMDGGRLVFGSRNHANFYPTERAGASGEHVILNVSRISGMIRDRVKGLEQPENEELITEANPTGKQPLTDLQKTTADSEAKLINAAELQLGVKPTPFMSLVNPREKIIVNMVLPQRREGGNNEEFNRVRRELQDVQAELRRALELNRSSRMNP